MTLQTSASSSTYAEVGAVKIFPQSCQAHSVQKARQVHDSIAELLKRVHSFLGCIVGQAAAVESVAKHHSVSQQACKDLKLGAAFYKAVVCQLRPA